MSGQFDADRWLAALDDRHAASMRRPELLKAIRALSARYVERRAGLPARSPLDSAGKRAAFAVFYGPMHFLTAREIVSRSDLAPRRVRTIVDLGCGTGAAGAAWAVSQGGRPELRGVDRDSWAVEEANWTWRTMGLRGRARRGGIVEAATDLSRSARKSGARDMGVVLGWTVNELDAPARTALLAALLELARAGTAILVIEPIARRLVPWWDQWAQAFAVRGGRDDEWRLQMELPAGLAALDEAAGFRREALSARTLCFSSC